MESNTPRESTTDREQQRQSSELNTEAGGALAPANAQEPASTDQPWREWVEPVIDVLSKLPDYIGRFFSDYKQPLLTLVLIVAAIIAVRITLAILDAVNSIPLLAPVFELVGLGYSLWFAYRYLLRASTREELGQEFNSLKGQVLGEES